MDKLEKSKRKFMNDLVFNIKNHQSDAEIAIFLQTKKKLFDPKMNEELYPYNPPLILCANRGHIKSTKTLLELGVDPNGTNYFNFSALHWAAMDNRPELMELLLNHNANIYQLNNDKHTIATTALQNGSYRLFDLCFNAIDDLNHIDITLNQIDELKNNNKVKEYHIKACNEGIELLKKYRLKLVLEQEVLSHTNKHIPKTKI